MNELIATYESDFYAWLLRNAQLIRQGQFSQIDRQVGWAMLPTIITTGMRKREKFLMTLLFQFKQIGFYFLWGEPF